MTINEGLQKWRDQGGKTLSRREKFIEKPTRKLAIEIFCIECMGGEEEKGIRSHIRGCTAYSCPLREFRPYK